MTLVNVWASWCVPCHDEAPLLMKLAEDSRIRIAGINYKDSAGQRAPFLWPLWKPVRRVGIDPSGRAAIEWGVYGVPETFVVDRDGRSSSSWLVRSRRKTSSGCSSPLLKRRWRHEGEEESCGKKRRQAPAADAGAAPPRPRRSACSRPPSIFSPTVATRISQPRRWLQKPACHVARRKTIFRPRPI